MKKVIYLIFALIALALQLPPKKVTVLLAGDSTMANKPLDENPERGWGQLIPSFFTGDVIFKNFAVNGRSTKSFIAEGKWDSLVAQITEGDYVMIQFGHNDSKQEDSTRFAAPHTLYKENLTKMVNDVRKKGGLPVLITPVMRRKFDANGKFVDQHGDYPGVVRELAKSLNVPLIDLHRSSEDLLNKEGEEGSKNLYLHIPPGHFKKYKGKEEDNTHFSEYGASSMAALVCQAILDQHLPLEKYLRPSDFKEKWAFELPKIYLPHFKKDTVNITSFGAMGDGYFLNTSAINQAISSCALNGGGTVLIPAGVWLTGPIVMKSNIDLHLDKDALVIFTKDFSAYPLVLSSFEGVDAARCQSPISAEHLENIAITGQGIFDGNGQAWRPLKKGKLNDTEWKKLLASGGVLTEDKSTWFPSEGALKGYNDKNIGKLDSGKSLSNFESIKDFLRPNMIRIVDCRNILLEGVTFENSPAWTTHLMLSRHITLKGIKVKNPWYGTNTDGLDLESCTHALVEDCVFDTGDDGICIKSGRDEEGRKRGKATENVIVQHCTVYHAHGGFVIGSEMSGGVNNMFVSHCSFIGTDIGLRFKTARGRGGLVQNVYASNINMKDIAAEALLFDMYYMAKDPVVLSGEKREPPKVELLPVDVTTPVFKNFFIRNVTCNGAEKAILIRGIPEMHIKNILLENMLLQTNQGVDIQEASGITFKAVTVLSKLTNPVIYLLNSDAITFEQFNYSNGAALLIQTQGERTNHINFNQVDASKAQKKVTADFGSKETDIIWKN